MKKGRFSKAEQNFIKEHHQDLSVEQIATQLDRDAVSVDDYIIRKLGKTALQQKEREASYDIITRPYWREIEEKVRRGRIT